MVTKVYLIRHGETEDADSRRYKGHIDVPLSASGIDQIKKLSELISCKGEVTSPLLPIFRSSELMAVYCSDLGRAVKSAEIIAGPFGLKPVIVENLKERNFGVWEGMTFDEIKDRWPDAFTAWAENPLRFSPIEGESTLEARDRVLPVFNEITDSHKGQNIAIVSHGGVIRIILCELLGIPLENIFRIEQGFAALNVIEMWDYPVVKHINYMV
jgi:alpha-ribazole phosphatase/probable phosphoglycerate mutase